MARAKPDYEGKAAIFNNGRSQAVRLPKECRFDDVTEVSVRKIGNEVILSPIFRSWKQYFDRSSRPTDDFVDAVLNREDLPEDPERESF